VRLDMVGNFLSLIVIYFGLSVFSLANTNAVLRLAILNEASSVKGASDFADMIFEELSPNKDIELIERTRIDMIIKEQKLSLDFSSKVDASLAIKLGKLLSADAILLMKPEKDLNKKDVVRMRLLNTQCGFKLYDSVVDVKPQAEENLYIVKAISKIVLQQMKRMNVDVQHLLPVSVLMFRSEEISPKYDWLQSYLSSLFERKLLQYPGVVEMERISAGTLLSERDLVGTLPDSLRSSAVMIDGSYRMFAFTNGISITVNALRCGRVVAQAKLYDSMDKLDEMGSKLITQLLSKINASVTNTPMNPADEAEMLIKQARIYMERDDKAKALEIAEAAHAIAPDSLEALIFLVDLLISRQGEGRLSSEMKENYLMRTMCLVEDVLNRGSLSKEPCTTIWSCFLRASYYMENGARSGRHEEIIQEAFKLCELCRCVYAGKSQKMVDMAGNFGKAYAGYFRSIDEMDKYLPLVPEYYRLPEEDLLLKIVFFRDAAKGHPEVLLKVEDCLAHRRKSSDMHIRGKAIDQSTAFYSTVMPDEEKLLKVVQEYFEWARIQKQIRPEILLVLRYSSDRKKSREIGRKKYEEALAIQAEFTVKKPMAKPESAFVPDVKIEPKGSWKPLIKNTDERLLMEDLVDIQFERGKFSFPNSWLVYSTGGKYGVIVFGTNILSGKINVIKSSACCGAGRPIMTVTGSRAVCLGFPDSGILIFRKDGTSQKMDESNGLPCNMITDLVGGMKDDLYATIRIKDDIGLMYVNLGNGYSTILTSTKTENKNSGLGGKPISGIAFDHVCRSLIVLSGDDVYQYDHRKREFNLLNADIVKRINKSIVFSNNYWHSTASLKNYNNQTEEKLFPDNKGAKIMDIPNPYTLTGNALYLYK